MSKNRTFVKSLYLTTTLPFKIISWTVPISHFDKPVYDQIYKDSYTKNYINFKFSHLKLICLTQRILLNPV